MSVPTTDRRWRVAAVLSAAAAMLTAAATATPAGAQEPVTTETTATSVPVTTIPDDTSTTVDTAPDGSTTTEVPTTTAGEPPPTATTTTGEGETTTTTRPPTPPSWDMACKAPYEWPYRFLIDDVIEEGDSFDDPGSDFSVTFTDVELVDGSLQVTFEGSHPMGEVVLSGLYSRIGFILSNEVGAPPNLTYTIPLPPDFGISIVWAAFCFGDPEDIGVELPVAPTVTGPPNPEGEVPVTATVPMPVQPEGNGQSAGTLPKTGSDALPVALAGVGLAAVGGALLLGRRLRRARASGLGGGGTTAHDVNELGDAAGSAAIRERTSDGRTVWHAAVFPHDG